MRYFCPANPAIFAGGQRRDQSIDDEAEEAPVEKLCPA